MQISNYADGNTKINRNSTIVDVKNLHPSQKIMLKAKENKLKKIRAQNSILSSTYELSPYQQKLISENERLRNGLMAHRERERGKYRKYMEQVSVIL